MHLNRILSLITCTLLLGTGAMAQNNSRKVEPVVMAGTGLYIVGPFSSDNGLATSISAAVDVKLNESWSVMPKISAREVAEWEAFTDRIGGDPDMFGMYDFSISARYHFQDKWAVGLGPYFSKVYNPDHYYIDADPSDVLNNKEKIKSFGFGIQPTIDYNVGKHWKFGVVWDICLTDMVKVHDFMAYTPNPKHINSVEFFAGFRF